MSEVPKAETPKAGDDGEVPRVEDVDLGDNAPDAAAIDVEAGAIERALSEEAPAAPGKEPLAPIPGLALDASESSLFLALVASVILLIATGAEYKWKIAKSGSAYSRYAISVSSIAIILSFAGLVMAKASKDLYSKACKPLNATLFVYSFVGACFLTFREPFTKTSNGYFAAWAIVYGSAMALGTEARALDSKIKGLEAVMGLLASSLVVLIASADFIRVGCPKGVPDADCYEDEAAYALALACLTAAYAIGTVAAGRLGRSPPGAVQFAIVAFLSACWIVEAPLVTFRGPFGVTGNGYFGSWVGAATSTMAALANLRSRDEW